MPKHFTLAEARKLLPYVGELVREAVELKAGYDKAEGELEGSNRQIAMMGGMRVDHQRINDLKSRREECATKLDPLIARIHELGCQMKDLDIGLIDFPALLEGQEVLLCWKLGEPDIGHWHGADEGFAGRKPIDRDFLDRHQGGSAQ